MAFSTTLGWAIAVLNPKNAARTNILFMMIGFDFDIG
jgi:hypothetical protein